jgi:hypothetical protein
MKKNILSLAALLIASATVFTACSSDDNITSEQPANSVQKTYTMTVNATKGGDATTRALTLGRNDANTKNVLNATWATTENVYVKKGDTWATGSLQPESDGATATLKGELSGIGIAADDVLTLQFPKSGDISYDGQDGLLSTISANYDYAQASVTVASVDGNDIKTVGPAHFTNQQAIVKFTIKDKSNNLLNATKLTINVNDSRKELIVEIPSSTYTTNGDGIVYVAIPGFTSKNITLSAVVGNEVYSYTRSGVTFTNGHYYPITVKMTKQVHTTANIGKIIATNGLIYENASAATTAGTVAAGMIAYLGSASDCAHGLAIALTDESDTKSFGNAGSAASQKNTDMPVGCGTWRIPSMSDWQYMFLACRKEGDTSSAEGDMKIAGFQEKISSVGTGFADNTDYWTATPTYYGSACFVRFSGGTQCSFQSQDSMSTLKVRAVLAF